MGGRDHSYECDVCGVYRSGLNDLRCNCDPCEVCGEHGTPDAPCLCERTSLVRNHLLCLAGNLEVAGALCASFRAGDNFGFHMGSDESQCTCQWSPGSGEPYRGSTRCEQDGYFGEHDADLDDEDVDVPLGCCPRHTWGDEFHDPGCTGAKP